VKGIITMSRLSSFVLSSAIALLWASCAQSVGPGAGFDIHFPDNRASDIGAIASQIASRPVAEEPTLVVVAPPAPARGIAVFSLPEGRRLWQTATRVDSRPVIAGGLVVAHANGQVIAWDARSGEERWHLPDQGYSLIGAGGDNDYVALSLGPGGISQRHGVFVVVDARSGSVRFEKEVEQALGVPTAVGGYAFVPWNGQYFSIVDIGSGRERARIRSQDDLFGRADHEGNAVYFGSRVLYRLSEASAVGHRQGSETYAIPPEDLPGNPPLLTDGYSAAFCGVNARERVAVVTREDPTRPGVHLLDDTAYVLFHRVLFALDASNGRVRWAHLHNADISGVEPVRGGVVFMDERGNAVMLDGRAGNVVYQQNLGQPTAQAVFSLPLTFAPPHANEEPAESPAATLIAAAGGTDNRLLPARIFATRALASIPGDEATRGLLDIAGRQSYPQELRAAAGEALAHRTDGVDAMLVALQRHADWLHQVSAPPVGFIARALANAHERRAVAPLTSHLNDPETAATELPLLVAALKEFADPAALPALLDFVRLYHADEGQVPPVGEGEGVNDRSLPEQNAINAALELAIEAIGQFGTPDDRRWLQAMADDANTLDPVRVVLERTLNGPSGAPANATASSGSNGAPNANGSGGGDDEPEIDDPNLPPPRLTADMISDGFSGVRDQMMHCMDGMTSRPSQVRITFRYDNEGHVSNVLVLPAVLQRCIAQIAQGVTLRRSQTPRDIATYYLIGGN
jgi:outer membrane protein assembly factor BamB